MLPDTGQRGKETWGRKNRDSFAPPHHPRVGWGLGNFCVHVVKSEILLDIHGENTPGRRETGSHGNWIIFNATALWVQTEA